MWFSVLLLSKVEISLTEFDLELLWLDYSLQIKCNIHRSIVRNKFRNLLFCRNFEFTWIYTCSVAHYPAFLDLAVTFNGIQFVKVSVGLEATDIDRDSLNRCCHFLRLNQILYFNFFLEDRARLGWLNEIVLQRWVSRLILLLIILFDKEGRLEPWPSFRHSFLQLGEFGRFLRYRFVRRIVLRWLSLDNFEV